MNTYIIVGTDDYQVYRYDSVKTLVWLKEKVRVIHTDILYVCIPHRHPLCLYSS